MSFFFNEVWSPVASLSLHSLWLRMILNLIYRAFYLLEETNFRKIYNSKIFLIQKAKPFWQVKKNTGRYLSFDAVNGSLGTWNLRNYGWP